MHSEKTAAAIRSEFLDYFRSNGHTIVESSGLLPQNDPTLLFTNAGMVQFKDVFLGTDPRPYQRAASSQKCVRAGGKHNDLENVGFTARHHTFFEMLGNFSFGDYFKKDAIHYAWDFITNKMHLKREDLYVTVFTTDDEAAMIWEKQEKIPRERILRFGEKDNFWAMGDTGPCGPCSEIFVDRGKHMGCHRPDCAVGCSCDRFMEIWNLVFMQYNRSAEGKLTPLPKPSIDTGMGLERLASVLQKGETNYDTDLFQGLIRAIPHRESKDSQVALRVLADHCRSTNFLIADGVLPSNEGRGYVLRRIMRRAIRYGKQLGFTEPFFYKMTAPLIAMMGEAYPELKDKQTFLERSIRQEEERFLVTLENGLQLLEKEMKVGSKKILAGEVAFRLYDTFGFPLDLTQVIARERGYRVDEAGFERAMSSQRERSRENWKGSGEVAVEEKYKDLQRQNLKTDFIGYDTTQATGRVLAVLPITERRHQLLMDRTPFYAESGGQVGDQGMVESKGGFRAKVTDTQKPIGDCVLLDCEIVAGSCSVGEELIQTVDVRRRELTMKNHTATHLLHYALRHFLGAHVKQAGSLVHPDFLRFDFTHNKPLTADEIRSIEDFVNEAIQRRELVSSIEMEKQKAQSLGAIAFFGDKYGERVRVVSVNTSETTSVEFCGGTHAKNTSDLQLFKVQNESGIASGVRRILAITGPAVLEELRKSKSMIERLQSMLKASAPDELAPKIEKLLTTERELRRSLEAQSRKSASGSIDQWIQEAKTFRVGSLIAAQTTVPDGQPPAKLLRELADQIRSRVSKTVVALGAWNAENSQSFMLIAVTKDIQDRVKANEIIKEVAPLLGGSGGGKPDLAQAGGKNAHFSTAFQAIETLLSKL